MCFQLWTSRHCTRKSLATCCWIFSSKHISSTNVHDQLGRYRRHILEMLKHCLETSWIRLPHNLRLWRQLLTKTLRRHEPKHLQETGNHKLSFLHCAVGCGHHLLPHPAPGQVKIHPEISTATGLAMDSTLRVFKDVAASHLIVNEKRKPRKPLLRVKKTLSENARTASKTELARALGNFRRASDSSWLGSILELLESFRELSKSFPELSEEAI